MLTKLVICFLFVIVSQDINVLVLHLIQNLIRIYFIEFY